MARGIMILLVLVLALLVSATEAQVAARALETRGSRTSDILAALRYTRRGVGQILLAGDVAPVVALALTLSTVGALLGGEVADGLEQTALSELAGCETVDAVLELVDLVDARDL